MIKWNTYGKILKTVKSGIVVYGCSLYLSLFFCTFEHFIIKNKNLGVLPNGPVVKNLPSNAADVGWIPGQGTKIPHAKGGASESANHSERSCLLQLKPDITK